MKMSEEMAVRLHGMMWSDMQKALGNNPSVKERAQFKYAWIHEHFPGESIANDCWLCEYASSVTKPSDYELYCEYCPVSWPNCHCNTSDFSYAMAPISEILALPARNDKITTDVSAAQIKNANYETELVRSYYENREQLLSKASGRPASTAIDDHVKAIREKAVEEYFKQPSVTMEPLRIACMKLANKLDRYENALSVQSGLDRNIPVDDHIREIVKNSIEAGATEERERIMDKVKEVLNQ